MRRSKADSGRGLADTPAKEFDSIFSQGMAFHRADLLPEAEQLYRRVLQVYPQHFDSLHLLGVIAYQRGEYADAVRQIDVALKLKPDVADAYNNRGNALKKLGRHEEALASYNQAIALKPDDAASFNNRGSVYKDLKRFAEAAADFDNAIVLKPDFAEAFNNRGNALWEMKRFEEALANYDRAIALKPDNADAFNNRGNALKDLGRLEEALASYDRASKLKPDYAQAFYNRGTTLFELRRVEDALPDLNKAIELKPDYAAAFSNRGFTLGGLKRFDEAAMSFGAALALEPEMDYVAGARLHAKMHACDWTNFEEECTRVTAAVARGAAASPPLPLLALPATAEIQFKCARSYASDRYPAAATPAWRGERYSHQRIRIAYLSSDLRNHPVAFLTAGLFECHDRTRFETIAISYKSDAAVANRERAAFDRLVNAQALSDLDVAKLVRELEVDIAVDLNGFTEGSRPQVFARRPAPVQVNYLGYAGTLGQIYWDYILADRFVIPEEGRGDYAEQVVYLPDTFMVTDGSRKISAHTPSREEAGLPDRGLVFCCFNNTFKITPNIFDVWMRLLREVEGSVLWLLAANTDAPNNLRREAKARGVAADRLIFAPRVELSEDYLARIRLADLFLDTLYYNAHATASDALWAGVPILTCSGTTFAGRVAGSLLRTVGLPELITPSLPDYEALALKLARDPVLLGSLRRKLADHREIYPLFDTERCTRHIEAAYTTMWERSQRGEPPQSFAVAPVDPRKH
jgi:predicted O-linked N-acetylglucosamine transferase (SPINDLY family)